MGWTQVKMEIVGHVSSHNSDQDRKDEADWREFVERVEMIAREHRYEALNLDVIGRYLG